MEEKKSPLLSKTLWINFIVGGLSLFWPPAAEYIASNPSAVLAGFSVINFVLRLITKEPVGIE
jgi:hypothetical protein